MSSGTFKARGVSGEAASRPAASDSSDRDGRSSSVTDSATTASRPPGSHQTTSSGTGGTGSPSSHWGLALAGLASTLAWMVCSSMLIILNKHLYRMGFTFPCFVTGLGQVFSAFGGWVLVRSGYLPLRPPPSWRFALTNLAPIWFSTTLTLFFGNVSYLYLSVAFIQILKAFTPALTLLLCVLAGLEKFQWPLLTSILLIAGGTAMAVMVESGTPAFQLHGFVAFMLSSITEASRVVGAEVLLGAEKYNSAEALLYISGPAAALLILGSRVWEWDGILKVGPTLFAREPAAFLAASFMSFLVNLTCFFAIQTTSSLTFKVAGCVKNVAVVVYGVMRHGEQVTLGQSGGYAVSVVGFAMYSSLKMKVKQRRISRDSKRDKAFVPSSQPGGRPGLRALSQPTAALAGGSLGHAYARKAQ